MPASLGTNRANGAAPVTGRITCQDDCLQASFARLRFRDESDTQDAQEEGENGCSAMPKGDVSSVFKRGVDAWSEEHGSPSIDQLQAELVPNTQRKSLTKYWKSEYDFFVSLEYTTNFAGTFGVVDDTSTNLPFAAGGARGSSLPALQTCLDPLFLNSNHQFIYEAMVIMEACQGILFPRRPMLGRSNPSLGEIRSLVDLVALSLVCDATPNDNAATAIYQTSTELQYITPNLRSARKIPSMPVILLS
jgi:hypothetical protein